MTSEFVLQIVAGAFVGAAAGYVGSFMILRRMALVGDALSHVALPGVALALIYGVNPILGAFTALFLGVVIIWIVEFKTNLSTEAIVGLMFTLALAIGLLITPEEEFFHALIGDIGSISRWDAFFSIFVSILIIIILKSVSKKLVLSTLSAELAESTGIRVTMINLVFLLIVGVIVALGIKAVGTLLMGALVIVPAITAKNTSSKFAIYGVSSAALGAFAMVTGLSIASFFAIPPGPAIIIVGSIIFLSSLLARGLR